jgi:hypothetical protein
MGWEVADILPLQLDGAGNQWQVACDQTCERTFSSPVAANNCGDLTGLQSE